MLREIRALGFEYVELGHNTRLSLLDGIRQAVTDGEVRVCSLHNFCPLPVGLTGPAPDYYLPSAPDERERASAVRHTLRTLECAAMLGASVVVLHLGRVRMRSYTMRLLQMVEDGRAQRPRFARLREKALALRARKREKFLQQVCRTLDEIVPRAKELGIRLGLETRFALEEIPNREEVALLMERYGCEVIQYWHDVGHAEVQEQLGLGRHEDWLTAFRGNTAGMHLQDVLPPAEDHRPPGQGEFDFRRLTPFVQTGQALVWEIHPGWLAEQIREGMERVKEHFVVRECPAS